VVEFDPKLSIGTRKQRLMGLNILRRPERAAFVLFVEQCLTANGGAVHGLSEYGARSALRGLHLQTFRLILADNGSMTISKVSLLRTDKVAGLTLFVGTPGDECPSTRKRRFNAGVSH
jgi:hypothetical protein